MQICSCFSLLQNTSMYNNCLKSIEIFQFDCCFLIFNNIIYNILYISKTYFESFEITYYMILNNCSNRFA